MKHIYSKAYSVALMLALTLITGCSDELTSSIAPSPPPTTGHPLTITATQGTKRIQTRLGYEEQTDGTVSVTWTTTDKLRLTQAPGNNQGATNYVPFALTTGAGKTTATFTEEGSESSHWTNNAPLYAIYGKQENITVTNKADKIYASCTYTGQIQTENGNNSHITDYDFMYAQGNYTSRTISNLSFKHAGALMKFTLTLPEEAANKKVNKLELSPEDGAYCFISTQHVAFDGSDNTLVDANEISLQLGNGNEGVPLANSKLTAYMMLAPTSEHILPGEVKGIMLRVYYTNKNYYWTVLKGSSIEAGKFYNVEETLINLAHL